MAKTISRFPIYPARPCTVCLPVGAKLLDVSLDIHTYLLRALVDLDEVRFESRNIVAYMDDYVIPDGPLGTYLGSCAQSGMHQRWHFFDQGLVVGGAVAAPAPAVVTGYFSLGPDICVCGGDLPRVRAGCGNWRSDTWRNAGGAA